MAAETRRRSVFHESGLDDAPDLSCIRRTRPTIVRFCSKDEVYIVEPYLESTERDGDDDDDDYDVDTDMQRSYLPQTARSAMFRYSAALFVLAAAVPLIQGGWISKHTPALPIQGVSGGAVPSDARSPILDLQAREDSPTSACFRWAQQSAVVNGTLYLYGGEASTSEGQTENTWNNNFLTIDLTKSWPIDSPPLTGLPRPSGPPAVALGALWNSHDSLFLYGGEFSWKPPANVPPLSLWEYDIHAQSWIEHSNPQTSSGKNAPSDGVPVQRAAEGAAASVPTLGRGFYFGGHQDEWTTPGWSYYTSRVYLQSLLEYTFPGSKNSQVNALKNGGTAGDQGVFRNITVGGLQASAGFTSRADGLLLYIPGYGDQGILVALAGGTNTTFTQMNEINIYDIATSSWYTQSTSGPTPKIRVNPCGVVAAAPDGSSYQIYMFGGQNLIPANDQTELNDLWILTIPAFHWIQVDQSNESIPYGRSGATCNVWDGQMIMTGGYLGATPKLTCESPGVYVLDLSTAKWVQQFTALSPGKDNSQSSSSLTPQPVNFDSTGSNNPFNQQPAQIPGGLEGSYGYTVPEIVVSVIGGSPGGSATVTTPIVTATVGPFATGSPVTYTVTNSQGSTVTQTSFPTSGVTSPGSTGSQDSSGGGGLNVAAIVVGIVCGLLFILIIYLLFCLFLYRKQLAIYKRHLEMAQRQTRREKGQTISTLYATADVLLGSDSPNRNQLNSSSDNSQPLGNDQGSGLDSSNQPSAGSGGYISLNSRNSRSRSAGSSVNLTYQEPTFFGVMLNPRRSLRVVNRD